MLGGLDAHTPAVGRPKVTLWATTTAGHVIGLDCHENVATLECWASTRSARLLVGDHTFGPGHLWGYVANLTRLVGDQLLATRCVMGGHVSAWPGPVLGVWVCCAGGHAYIVRGRGCRVTGVQRKTWADVRTEWNPTRYTWARMDAIIACAYVGPRVRRAKFNPL